MTVIEKLDMNVKQANSDFQAIKSKIVEKGVEVADGTPTADYASKVDAVYDAGKQAQLDQFWSDRTNNWTKTDYMFCFANSNYTNLFPPPKVIQPKSAMYIFHSSKADNTENFDFSKCTNFAYAFNQSKVKNVGPVDMSSDTNNHSAMFTNSECESVSLKGLKNLTTGIGFTDNTKIKEIRIEGVLPCSFTCTRCVSLSRESILNIFNAMADTPVSGATLTLSPTAVANAFGSTSSQEWLDLTATKPKWAISLL